MLFVIHVPMKLLPILRIPHPAKSAEFSDYLSPPIKNEK